MSNERKPTETAEEWGQCLIDAYHGLIGEEVLKALLGTEEKWQELLAVEHIVLKRDSKQLRWLVAIFRLAAEQAEKAKEASTCLS